ncbi:IS1595 family transposase [Flavobacterium ajazii]|uniref:IS1595 family transposase n=1 Tax=Flavobacterium ajazii TaxID=2692318 RepID=UPI001FEA1315|nr:IS1595 family transposase [Flavobacterium ajazii]
MASIKYDFTTCYNSYDFSQTDYEEIYQDFEPTSFQEACEDILRYLLIKWGLEEAPEPTRTLFPDPVKLLTTRPKKTRKTLPITPKSIIFNKTKMSKHPDIELNTAQIFKSVYDMGKVLNTEIACREHLEKLRWNGEPICPHCGSQRDNHYRIKKRGYDNGYYKCKDCRLPFSVTKGTIFEKSTVPLQKWFRAIFKFTTNKKGMSSYELMREIGVTQKTAWFMLSRIRNAVRMRDDFEFDGITQVDETYVGGKNKNRSKGKKIDNTQGRSTKTKTPVFGMLNSGIVYTQVIENAKGKTLKGIIDGKVKKGSTVVSDGWRGYRGLERHYSHEVIKHNLGLFKKGAYHTNGIEGFWGLLKRGIVGIYHKTSDKHLHRYCDEFAYRYNIRTMSLGEQFNLTLINCDERLRYKELIAKV